MKRNFILSCESTVDLPYSYMQERDISVLFYTYLIDGTEYTDDMMRDPETLETFYRLIREGHMPTTSQINEYRYLEYFTALLEKGDVLHIAFGSGMTPSVRNARSAAEQLKEQYPHRKLLIVDSTCASAGYGLFVDDIADRCDRGETMEAVEAWANAHAPYMHHQFFSTDFTMFKRSGRVSGAAAAMGTLLGICPMMRLNLEGRIVAFSKVRGRKAAVRGVVNEMLKHAENGADYDGKCFISNSHCPEDAEATREAIEEAFPNLRGKIKIVEIGAIIASHCGPGTVAVFFWGDQRIA